jgi:hypothetical protein
VGLKWGSVNAWRRHLEVSSGKAGRLKSVSRGGTAAGSGGAEGRRRS